MSNFGYTNRRTLTIALAATLATMVGCQQKQQADHRLLNPYGKPMTLVIAPVLNYSGNKDIDPIKVTDILFSELQQVEGFAVIPVNRIIAQMVREKVMTIETPQQALELASELGADAIIVSAITEYNPFYPPIVGITMQIYGWHLGPQGIRIDPVALQRSASPLEIETAIDPKYWPKNQMQRIYNARDQLVVKQVKKFADNRGTANSPYKWEIYLRSQEYYLRFVYYKAIEELLDKECRRISYIASTQETHVKEYN